MGIETPHHSNFTQFELFDVRPEQNIQHSILHTHTVKLATLPRRDLFQVNYELQHFAELGRTGAVCVNGAKYYTMKKTVND